MNSVLALSGVTLAWGRPHTVCSVCGLDCTVCSGLDCTVCGLVCTVCSVCNLDVEKAPNRSPREPRQPRKYISPPLHPWSGAVLVYSYGWGPFAAESATFCSAVAAFLKKLRASC